MTREKNTIITPATRGTGQLSRRLLLASGLAAGVSACSKPSGLIGVSSTRELTSAEKGRAHRIYIATTRRASEVAGDFYGGERGSDISYAAVDVVVPTIHQSGKVERPRTPPVDPDKHFVITNPSNFTSKQDFRGSINSDLLKLPRGKRQGLLWVHGYNTSLTLAVLRFAQFVEDTGYTGIPILFSWASQAKLTGYVYDINSALMARDYLEQVPEAVKNSPIEGLDIIAHSMGNFAVMEAIRGASGRDEFNYSGKVRTVILADPDIDIDLFATQLRGIPKNNRGFFVLTSGDDKALALSAKISRRPRVGQLTADQLTDLGVNVIDLSQVKDSSSTNHTKFLNSPEIVKLLGDRVLAGDSYADHTRFGLGESIVVGASGAVLSVDEVGG